MNLIANMQTLQQRPEQPCKHVFVKTRDGELACKFCGEVKQSFNMVARLPMDVTYQPTSQIVFGRGLGNTLNRYGLLKVLAHGPRGAEDVGIRSRQIRLMVQTVEPPGLQRCLEYASKILTQLNFSDNSHEKNVIVSNMVGACVRKLYAFVTIAKLPFKKKEMVEAAVFFTLSRLGFEPDPPAKVKGDYLQTNLLCFHKKYLDVCELLNRKTQGF